MKEPKSTTVAMGSATDVPPSAPPSAQRAAENGIVADLADKQLDQQGQLAKISHHERSKVAITEIRSSRTTGIIVSHHDAQPKELEHGEEATGAVAATPPPPPPSPAPAKPTPEDYKSQKDAPPTIAQAAPSVDDATVTPTTPGAGGASAGPAGKATTSQDTWARDQHTRVSSLVHAGRCQDAAPLAVEIQRARARLLQLVCRDGSLAQAVHAVHRERGREAGSARAKADAAKAAKAAPAADATK